MSGSGSDVHTLEHNCRRVTAADVASVTAADVRSVVQSMTPDEFRAALRVMASNNKTAEVINNSEPEAFRAALSGVNHALISDASEKVKQHPPMQASLLATATDGIRAACAETLQRMRPPQPKKGS